MKCEVLLNEFTAGKHHLCVADLEKLYAHWREQINTENLLYNQRIIWLITIQAFLYATVGLLFRARYTAETASIPYVVDAIILVVCGLGITISGLSKRLLSNARNALELLREGWNNIAEAHRLTRDAMNLFPHISGGDGKPGKSKWWHRQSGNLPTLFSIAWFLFAVIIICDTTVRFLHSTN